MYFFIGLFENSIKLYSISNSAVDLQLQKLDKSSFLSELSSQSTGSISAWLRFAVISWLRFDFIAWFRFSLFRLDLLGFDLLLFDINFMVDIDNTCFCFDLLLLFASV
ncbi:hypothetical protein L6452_14178 [Arctium lappa]|uniref:Uncharacterized protein n=1 Tax=Arctium lappa TaxID=4217 RepID=A0ACB9CKK9_ARCLA|nr:hypothetical protein L6452_14178 [Arctium lappa]